MPGRVFPNTSDRPFSLWWLVVSDAPPLTWASRESAHSAHPPPDGGAPLKVAGQVTRRSPGAGCSVGEVDGHTFRVGEVYGSGANSLLNLAGTIHRRFRQGQPTIWSRETGSDKAVNRSCGRTAPFPHQLNVLFSASSGPEVGHGRTLTDVLIDLLEELPVRPTAAQPHHDPPATDDHRCRHLDEQ